MRVTLLYFAALRELAGAATESLSLPAGVRTARELLELLELRAAFRGKLSSTRVAINEQFSDLDERLSDGDTVALIPPVQGG